MKWIDASDQLPADQQEVLIKSEGQVNLAKYQEGDSSFLLRNGTVILLAKVKVEWLELVAPAR